MKYLIIVVAMFAATATASAFAQSNSSDAPGNSGVAQVASSDESMAQKPGRLPVYGQPLHEKTRAEVYQELVHAQQDGQLAYLNSTVYAHN